MPKRKRSAGKVQDAEKERKYEEMDEQTESEYEEYEVEQICGRKGPSDSFLYLVKWKNYEKKSWEPADNLDCDEKIAEYERDKAARAKGKAKRVTNRRLEEVRDDGDDDEVEESKSNQETQHTVQVAAFDTPANPLCLVCGAYGGVNRKCDSCSSDMHHYCSHEIANSLGLEDFGTRCFCSRECYTKASCSPSAALETQKDSLAEIVSHENEAKNAARDAVEAAKQAKARAKITNEFVRDARNSEKVAKRNVELSKQATRARENVEDADLMDKLVAFAPSKELWVQKKKTNPYKAVGSTYLVGIVCRRKKKVTKEDLEAINPENTGQPTKSRILFEVRWLETLYNNQVEFLDRETLARGRKNFMQLEEAEKLEREASEDESDSDDVFEEYEHQEEAPTTLEEVESIKSMRFLANQTMDQPTDLFKHEDGTTTTRVKKRFSTIFQGPASACFLAYLPMSFWMQTLDCTNVKLRAFGSYGAQTPFSIQELLNFFGILLYMKLFPKGEYANYWGAQEENDVLQSGSNVNLDHIMSLRRFKTLRSTLSFSNPVSLDDLNSDPAAKIRPLLNILKRTGPRYVDVGRNVAIDEASVACRSKYGRHVITFNPQKPTGKFHFRLVLDRA